MFSFIFCCLFPLLSGWKDKSKKKKLPWSKLWKNVHVALIEYAEIWQLICFHVTTRIYDIFKYPLSNLESYSYELADSNNNFTNYWLFYNRMHSACDYNSYDRHMPPSSLNWRTEEYKSSKECNSFTLLYYFIPKS